MGAHLLSQGMLLFWGAWLQLLLFPGVEIFIFSCFSIAEYYKWRKSRQPKWTRSQALQKTLPATVMKIEKKKRFLDWCCKYHCGYKCTATSNFVKNYMSLIHFNTLFSLYFLQSQCTFYLQGKAGCNRWLILSVGRSKLWGKECARPENLTGKDEHYRNNLWRPMSNTAISRPKEC